MTPEVCPSAARTFRPTPKPVPNAAPTKHTGWSEEAGAEGLDLPDENFDYEEFVKREFGGGKNPKPRGIHWFWWVVGILLVAAFLWGLLRR